MRGLVTTQQTILSSASRTSSGQSNSFKIKTSSSIRIYVDVTTEVATSTLDVVIQTSTDKTTWYDAVSMDRISATGQYTTTATVVGPYIRVKYTIGGTSFVFSIKMTRHNFGH